MPSRRHLHPRSVLALALSLGTAACGSSGNPASSSSDSPSGGGGSGAGGGGAPGAGGSTGSGPRTPVAGGKFTENFDFEGKHAAVVNDGKGVAVHWNADVWDITGDTHAIAVMGEWEDKPGEMFTNSGHATYIHKAANPCESDSSKRCDSDRDDTALVPGGDGSAGIGVIHLDEQDIVGARLRNPMAISEKKPGIVRLRAPRFVTMGHWWEIALTPTDRVIGAENTVVESQGEQDGLGDPGGEANAPGKGAGPGHDPQEESFNVVVTGVTDFACENQTAEEGNLTRIAIKSLVKNKPAGLEGGHEAQTGYRFNAFNQKSMFSGIFYGSYQKNLIRPGLDGTKELPASMLKGNGSEDWEKIVPKNLEDEFNLYLWQFEFTPSGVEVLADFEDGRGLTLVEHIDLGVPWPEVHVHLMGVAYQNDHHPQVQSCYKPSPYTKREIRFRTVEISPMKYEKTWVFPPDGAPTDAKGNVLLCNDGKSCGRWMRYDMRDTHDFGSPVQVMVDGQAVELGRANSTAFSFGVDYAHGSTGRYGGNGLPSEKSFDLYVPITEDLKAAKSAMLVYNVLGSKGVANLSVNAHAVGQMPTADSVIGAWVKNDIEASGEGCNDYTCMSVRRSVSIDPALLVKDSTDGVVHLRIEFDQSALGTGTFIDRLQLELAR